jgi:DNA polymerase-3 subunit gamma/tau
VSSLYRKYRPEHFSELVGQDPVTNALKNAVREDRTGHAYLFSGPRGTGKTTTARILARALNCLDLGADGEPCGKCENCQAVLAGTFFDLVELDAASNNGVEAMRDLIQSVHLGVGASSRRKVYIVDEVHMLSTAA